MAQKSKNDLKTFFKGGDSPTTEQYQDLIESNLNLTDGNCPTNMVFAGDVTHNGSLTIGNIQSAANTDASFYQINGSRGEIRSQLQGGVAVDTGFVVTLHNSSILPTSLIVANVVNASSLALSSGAIITGSVVTANVLSAGTGSLNFFNTGAALLDNSVFTASFAIL